MSKIDDLNTQPKFDNALQVARTASIPSNEKYTASEWNALISKTNEVVGRANLNTWDIVTNYSELPNDPVNGQKVYVTGTGLNGHVSVQMMVNGKSSRGFYVYDAFSDLWVQKTSESELTSITFSIDTNWSGLPTEPNIGDIFELTTNDLPIPANVIGADPIEPAGKYQFNGTVWVAKSDTVLYQEVLAMLDGKLDIDMNNLSGDLTEIEQDDIKAKLNIKDGELKKIGNGYGLQHQVDNPSNYGTLGNNAVNLTFSNIVGDYGATGSVSYSGGYRTKASGNYSHSEGYETTASGLASSSEGRGTVAGSYAESARGFYNEIITPISTETFNSNDVIESVGVGTSSTRKNALTRWKNGAFKWLLQPLTNITNAVIGFHASDEDGRLNYHNGTEWKKYLIEGDSGGGAYIEIKDQFNDSSGDVDLDLITEEGTYVLKDPRDQDLNGLSHYAGDGPTNVQIDHYISDWYTFQRAIYYSFTNGKPRIAYRVKYLNDSEYGAWVEAKFVGVRLENLSSNLSTQQQDEIKGKLGIEDYNGVTPTVTASVITDYDIDIATQTEHWNLTMTGDTDFEFINMFDSGYSKAITITLEGDYAFTLPSWLKPLATSDDYDTMGGSLAAEIVINIKNGGTTPSGYYSLQMIDYAL